MNLDEFLTSYCLNRKYSSVIIGTSLLININYQVNYPKNQIKYLRTLNDNFATALYIYNLGDLAGGGDGIFMVSVSTSAYPLGGITCNCTVKNISGLTH